MSTFITYKLDGVVRKIPCKSVLTLGRDMNSDVVLPDLHASRNHAMIRCIGSGDYYLIDGGSSNGSFVNRQRVAMPRLLKNGDRITIGRFEMLFEQSKKETGEFNTLSLQDTVISDSPDIKQITVLVADIRGFTSLSEQVDIRTLTKLMNRWFHNVSNAIFDNAGTVDKFIGDCVFARWESDEDQSKTLKQALSAALLINGITRELNNIFSELPEPVKIGVGINTGAASMGIGHDNTALGDAVNIAFRLESATKILGSDMVLSETAYRHLPESFLEGKTHHLRIKGKRDPVRICSLEFNDVKQILEKMN
ncbi:adenylate/guanylate cyclase domain-containing protein [Thiohalophilus sp.]|uniref:adenylate/guanylate cyclase domain-containing protein n=1 Tax=Thiohalophilus sp. TaxID=3028392 RepID=UPI002ACDF6E3|nr:adenylate/guanylate cyclase domain-containing protein [Thiohalophilus sp.]MDZ7662198.1 adenylate/guanylate cyclase domain-containing protein [Thiohalophilus sp.]